MSEQQAELDELREQAGALEEEVVTLRRRIQDAPKRVRTLEERLLETKGQLQQAVTQNEKLTYTLREARDDIAALREEVEKLTQPPAAYGTVLGTNDDGTVDVHSGGRKMRVAVMPDVADHLNQGDEVALNESFSVILARSNDRTGEVVTVKDSMGNGRALIVGRADEERVCELSEELRAQGLRAGDTVLMDSRSGLLVEKLARPEVEELVLEEVPDISYEDVGGLDSQIEQIADAVELPFVHADLFAEHKLPAPKGILLYGPPGCGKEDFQLGKVEGLAPIAPLDDAGVFLEGFGPLSGKAVVDHATTDWILTHLQEKGVLFASEKYPHNYPHCWRCKTELLFRLVDEWFISMGPVYDKPRADVTAEEKDASLRYQIMDVVDQIRWIPGFGYDRELDWLLNMHDWMISKKRYYGLALPIYDCGECGTFTVIGMSRLTP